MATRMAPTSSTGSALELLTRSRIRLLTDGKAPWFATLALHLRPVEDAATAQGTMATDGTHLYYDPAWVAAQRAAKLMYVWAHEVLHCALLHPWRMRGLDARLAGDAADHVVNNLLADAGWTLPEDALCDRQYKGMAFEQVYALLRRQQRESPPAGGSDGDQDQDEPGSSQSGSGQDAAQDGAQEQPRAGGIVPAPAGGDGDDGDDEAKGEQGAAGAAGTAQDAPEGMTQSEWQIAAEEAALAARRAGTMPGGIDRAMAEARRVSTDCWEVLREFVAQTQPSDYSWARPNRRFVHQGLYLPGVVKENMPTIGVVVDTSSSVDQPLLDLFGWHIGSIMDEYQPEALHVIYCDTQVHHSETFLPGDTVKLNAKGGGGTLFQPALDWFSQQDEPPACVIYLTDLYGENLGGYGPTEPDYPVLWATTPASTQPAPFGERIVLPLVK